MRTRPARATDLETVARFTHNTFEWGDSVADSFLEWLDDPDGLLMVAVDDADVPIGVGRTVLMSEREAWLHAARADPNHRRTGAGSALNRAGCDWARSRGALIARLLIEAWNEPATNEVVGLGYRKTGQWVSATKGLAMEPTTNGARRVTGEERLTPARRTEVDLAWMGWTVSDLAKEGRQLFPIGWLFRRMRQDDLTKAAMAGSLWQCPSGWVVGSMGEDGGFDVSWIQTNDLDARRLVKAIIDLADGFGTEEIRGLFPATKWLTNTLADFGYSLRPSSIWSLTL